MGKKRREARLKQQVQAQQGRPLTGREMLRVFPSLFLRMMLVMLPVSFVMALLGASGLTLFNNVFVQFGCIFAVYLLLRNFIEQPIRQFRQQLARDAVQAPKAKAKP